MQYVFVAYIYDLNAILVCTLPSNTNRAMIAAVTDILSNLNAHGYSPTLNLMDNECSMAIIAHIQNNHMDIHIVPPHNHWVNAAEHAIATFMGILLLPSPQFTGTARSNSGVISSPRWN
jgi:hypothetical protein